jgi:hypothetical protein
MLRNGVDLPPRIEANPMRLLEQDTSPARAPSRPIFPGARVAAAMERFGAPAAQSVATGGKRDSGENPKNKPKW